MTTTATTDQPPETTAAERHLLRIEATAVERAKRRPRDTPDGWRVSQGDLERDVDRLLLAGIAYSLSLIALDLEIIAGNV